MAEFQGDVYVDGTLVADRMVLPLNSVGDGNFDPADPLGTDKQEHQIPVTYAVASDTTIAAATVPLYQAQFSGQVYAIYGTIIDPCTGNATVTIDILKNGTSILGTDFEFDSTVVAYQKVDAGIDEVEYVADDLFEVVVAVNAGTGVLAKGLLVTVVFRELPA